MTHDFLCDVTSYFNDFFFISFSIEFTYSLQISLNVIQGKERTVSCTVHDFCFDADPQESYTLARGKKKAASVRESLCTFPNEESRNTE